MVARGKVGALICPETHVDTATQCARALVVPSNPQKVKAASTFLKRNVRRCSKPSREARLAEMIQTNGLEMAVSVHCPDPGDESDEAKAAVRGFDSIASLSKRRRATKPKVGPRQVVYVADTEDVMFRRRRGR
jgi:hypothetical protein